MSEEISHRIEVTVPLTERELRMQATIDELNAKNAQHESDKSLLKILATKDELTGLENLRGLNEAFSRDITTAFRRRSKLVVITFDVDKFKYINDTYGHGRGDEILQKIASTFTISKRDGDTVARPSGDEFFFLLPEEPDTDLGNFHMERYQEALWQVDVSPKGHDRPLTISIGATIIDFNEKPFIEMDKISDEEVQNLIKEAKHQADINLYHSKINRDSFTVSPYSESRLPAPAISTTELQKTSLA